ncbi:MAG: transglycosylase SLT domain-containing protein [Proteobacteria bacterium]|nr:transglycosylase SLT domain-containing protein [Pseudomonadota bacterium]
MLKPTLARTGVAAALLALLTGCATTLDPAAAPPVEAGHVAVADAPAQPTATTPAPQTPAAQQGLPDEAMQALAVDPLAPDRSVDPEDATSQVDLWVRIRNGYAIPDLEGPLVAQWEQYYAKRPDYVARMTDRGGRYLFHIVEEVQSRGLPTELALLPFTESAFNPQAMSTAKASGMWQFVPATGRHYDLKQNLFRDDRRDVLASTRAALDYLERLYGMFGDWQLALASYNWGEGNVQRAIARNQKAGLPTDYASLRMPDETRHYLPKLQAVKNIVMQPLAYGLTLPELDNHPYFLSVAIERDIDVDLAAKLAGVSTEEFQQLNPQMNKPVILAAGTEQVLLPYDNANRFVANLRAHKGPLASWTAWVAPRTMRPADVAREVGMSEERLREVNRIPPRMVVKSGSALLVARPAAIIDDVSAQIADGGMLALAPDAPPLRRQTIRAGKKGETVASVARRYKVAPSQVAQWNKTTASARFKAGQAIVVYVPKSRSSAASTRTASSKSKASATRQAASRKPAATASKGSSGRARSR